MVIHKLFKVIDKISLNAIGIDDVLRKLYNHENTLPKIKRLLMKSFNFVLD